MTHLTTPLYSASGEDKTMVDYFLLDQQIGLDPKLRVYPDVEFLSVLSPAQSESMKPMRSNAQPTT
jgi:hypothetical protein